MVVREFIGPRKGVRFRTCEGTKQGSEVSPMLFGLFIEQLRHLPHNSEEKVPGAGPMILGWYAFDTPITHLVYMGKHCPSYDCEQL